MNNKYPRIIAATYLRYAINNDAAKQKNKDKAHSFFDLRMSLSRDSEQNIRYKS
jgi:hypothetical protein